MLLKTFAKREVYHIAGERGPDAAVLSATTWEPAEWASDPYCPFDRTFVRPLRRSPADSDGGDAGDLYEFLDRHYFNGSPLGSDQSWRRIDGDWLPPAA